jgi:hypothetical protein
MKATVHGVDPDAPAAVVSSGPALIPSQRHPVEQCWPNPRVALHLWVHLTRARADYDPRILAEVEFQVFRFYLPLARSIVRCPDDSDALDHDLACAELGLAKAILAWRQPDQARFEEYARRAIQSEIWLSLPHARRRNRFSTELGRISPSAGPANREG